MSQRKRIDVSISGDDASLDQVDKVVERLRAAGMTVNHVLAEIGAISGSIDEDRFTLLASVPGVSGVERGRQFELPPPDAEIQ